MGSSALPLPPPWEAPPSRYCLRLRREQLASTRAKPRGGGSDARRRRHLQPGPGRRPRGLPSNPEGDDAQTLVFASAAFSVWWFNQVSAAASCFLKLGTDGGPEKGKVSPQHLTGRWGDREWGTGRSEPLGGSWGYPERYLLPRSLQQTLAGARRPVLVGRCLNTAEDGKLTTARGSFHCWMVRNARKFFPWPNSF